jgi:hypothetical protein
MAADFPRIKPPDTTVPPPAGCARHREEMLLLALQKKLAGKKLSVKEREATGAEVARLEALLGLE